MNESTHSMHASTEAESDEISLLDLLQTIVENLRLLLLGPLIAGLLALGWAYSLTPTFTANTKFLPPQQQQSSAAAMLQSLGALGGLAGAASGLKNPTDQYVAFLKSRTLLDRLVDRFKLADRYQQKFTQDARAELLKKTRINSGKEGLISIDVDDQDPTFAAALANAYVEELGSLLSRLAITEAQQRRVFFEKQLSSAKDNLLKAELALKASGINSGALKANPEAAVDGLAKLQAMITAQEVKVASMRGYLTDDAPDFRQAQTELAALRTQVRQAENEDAPGLSGNSDYVTKYRDFKYFETLFELFAKQYEIARVDESRESGAVQVVDAAIPPERQSKPSKAIIAILAAFISGIALLMFIFARQAMRHAVLDPESSAKLYALHQAWIRTLGKRPLSSQ